MPKTEVYRNLHKNCFSIRQNGRVVGYLYDDNQAIVLEDVKFVVQPAGRKKVLKEKKKNVHAFVRGVNRFNVFPVSNVEDLELREVTYNPYKKDSFFYKDTGAPIKTARAALIQHGKVWAC